MIYQYWLFVTPWTTAHQASLSINNSRNILKLVSIESVMSPNHRIFCRLLLWPNHSLSASGSFQMSQFFASSGQSIGVSASVSVLPMNIQKWFPLGWTGFISLLSKGLYRVFSNTMDWFYLLAVQEALQSLLQYHSSKASILWLSAFFIVQLEHQYMTTGKTIALTRWTFVGKVMSLLFNMLFRLVITFLPRSKHLLIS